MFITFPKFPIHQSETGSDSGPPSGIPGLSENTFSDRIPIPILIYFRFRTLGRNSENRKMQLSLGL